MPAQILLSHKEQRRPSRQARAATFTPEKQQVQQGLKRPGCLVGNMSNPSSHWYFTPLPPNIQYVASSPSFTQSFKTHSPCMCLSHYAHVSLHLFHLWETFLLLIFKTYFPLLPIGCTFFQAYFLFLFLTDALLIPLGK